MDEVFIAFVVVALIVVYCELRVIKQKVNMLENKIDTLLEKNGIFYDKKLHVSKDVLTALSLGHKLKAIRLYSKQTGASFKDAQATIDRLISNT